VPFLRLTRDQRGYETTVLLHPAHAGERPRVLYWYRSAPGVRVGRPALDEDAIRAIEEQHPDIEFDWAQILEVGAAMAADIEHRDDRSLGRGPSRGSRPVDGERGPQRGGRGDPERGRRKPSRSREQPAASGQTAEASAIASPMSNLAAAEALVTSAPFVESQSVAPLDPGPEATSRVAAEPAAERHVSPMRDAPPQSSDVLSELVGREIATRLRTRYASIAAGIEESVADAAVRDAWRARAAALNPDSWLTADLILRGIQQADRLFEELRRELAKLAVPSQTLD
jgi:hypothetical protein